MEEINQENIEKEEFWGRFSLPNIKIIKMLWYINWFDIVSRIDLQINGYKTENPEIVYTCTHIYMNFGHYKCMLYIRKRLHYSINDHRMIIGWLSRKKVVYLSP